MELLFVLQEMGPRGGPIALELTIQAMPEWSRDTFAHMVREKIPVTNSGDFVFQVRGIA